MCAIKMLIDFQSYTKKKINLIIFDNFYIKKIKKKR